jgi:hypothetical protein
LGMARSSTTTLFFVLVSVVSAQQTGVTLLHDGNACAPRRQRTSAPATRRHCPAQERPKPTRPALSHPQSSCGARPSTPTGAAAAARRQALALLTPTGSCFSSHPRRHRRPPPRHRRRRLCLRHHRRRRRRPRRHHHPPRRHRHRPRRHHRPPRRHSSRVRSSPLQRAGATHAHPPRAQTWQHGCRRTGDWSRAR